MSVGAGRRRDAASVGTHPVRSHGRSRQLITPT